MPSEPALAHEPIVPIGVAVEPAAGAAPGQAGSNGPSGSGVERPVQSFHLHQPSLLSPLELRRLQLRHEEFARSLATRLSIHLRLEVAVRIAGLETCFYPQLIERLPTRTQLALFRIESMDGVGLIEVPPALGIAIVDRLLGGTGKVDPLERDLSEIEASLLDQAIDLLLKEWCQVVPSMPDPRPTILSHETNPRFLQMAPSDAGVLVLVLEFKFQDVTAKVHIGWPSAMFRPVIQHLSPPAETKQDSSPAPVAPLRWNNELNSVRIPLTFEWDGVEIDARKLAQLKVGDVLPIASDRINHTCVRLAKVPKFAGRLGKCGKTWAIELIERI